MSLQVFIGVYNFTKQISTKSPEGRKKIGISERKTLRLALIKLIWMATIQLHIANFSDLLRTSETHSSPQKRHQDTSYRFGVCLTNFFRKQIVERNSKNSNFVSGEIMADTNNGGKFQQQLCDSASGWMTVFPGNFGQKPSRHFCASLRSLLNNEIKGKFFSQEKRSCTSRNNICFL